MATKRRKSKKTETAPVLLKLCFGGITGWWDCLRCGWSLPGQLNPENHNCRRDNPNTLLRGRR